MAIDWTTAGSLTLDEAKTLTGQSETVADMIKLTEHTSAAGSCCAVTLKRTCVTSFAIKSASEAAGAKIRLTYMAQPAMVAALETGAIDGFVAGSPIYARPVLSGTA